MASKVYGIIIELKGDFRIDELKYSANLTISDAKKFTGNFKNFLDLTREK